jgi:hypothetical protein
VLYAGDQITCQTPCMHRLLFLFQKLIRPVPGYSGRNLFPGQLHRHIYETSLRSHVRQFASKRATALPLRTVTRCDGSQCIYRRPSLPSGTVTGTAAPLRAATWRPPAETVGVVEHLPRSPRPWSRGINTGAGVSLLFLPPQCLLLPPLPCLLRFAAGLGNREGTPPPSPLCTPAPPLAAARHPHLHRCCCCALSQTLLGDIGSPSASSPLAKLR